MNAPIKVLGIPGSLRAGSFNRMALRAAGELAPEGMIFETCEIREIPMYDGDVETAEGLPDSVKEFRAKIQAADALVITTPEYNASISGVLKNAIDWASRPPQQPFDGKPIAILGTSPGALGTVRAQAHLRQILANLNGLVLVQPNVMISGAGQRFDASGALTDDATREFVRGLMAALLVFTRKMNG
jgi:chromate reductase